MSMNDNSFIISTDKFLGTISVQEITNPLSSNYGMYAVAFQEFHCKMPVINFVKEHEVAGYINAVAFPWRAGEPRVKGERAPQDVNIARAAQ